MLRRRGKINLGTAWPFSWGQKWGIRTFAIDFEQLATHMYVVGRSGKGKSKFLEGLLWQLIQQGHGCGLVDPHGDLADNLLKLLSAEPLDRTGRTWLADENNAARLVYVEPGRSDYYSPMNVLADDNEPYTVPNDSRFVRRLPAAERPP